MTTPTVVCVLGSYGEFVGYHIADQALKRDNVLTKILVRPGYDSDASKKAKVDSLVAKGAVIVYGDASIPETLLPAFDGVDVVISALGGWGPVDVYHQNVYAACREAGVKRIVPAQFGVDILSLPPEDMDDYMRKKRGWNLAAIESGVPYTIVSQGVFSQWLLTMPNNPFIHHDTKQVDYCERDDVLGCLSTSLEDTARFTVDTALDPAMANRRVSIVGQRISAASIAATLSRVTGATYSTRLVRTFEEIEAAKSTALSKEVAFNNYILGNWAKQVFTAGFEPPFLLDTQALYGWTPETFDQVADRVLGRV